MKTKLQVALAALEKISLGECGHEAERAYHAVLNIKAMPEENCANCKNSVFCKIRNQLLCIGNEMRGRITEEDFCSRFEAGGSDGDS